MFKVVLLSLLMLISIGGTLSVLMHNLMSNAMIVENMAVMRGAANKLKQSAIYINGNYYMPYGEEDGTDYHKLPDDFYGLRKSAQGTYFIYCPYAPSNSLAATDVVTLNDETTNYEVTIDTTLTPSGNAYVTSSEAPPVEGLAALLIHPIKRSVPPSCADVTVNAEGEFVLTGDSAEKGILYPVSFDEIAFLNRTGKGFYLSSSSESGALQEALEEASLKASDDITITVESGLSFTLSSSHSISSSDKNNPRTITLKSATPGSAFTIRGSSATSLLFSNVNVVMTDVSVGQNVSVETEGSTLSMERASAPDITFERSKVFLDSVDLGRNGASSVPVSSDSSQVYQSGPVTLRGGGSLLADLVNTKWVARGNIGASYTGGPVVFQMANSQMDVRSATITSNGNGHAFFYVDPSSSLDLGDVAWSNSGVLGYGFIVRGAMTVYGSALNGNQQVSVGLRTEKGSRVYFDSSSIGTSSAMPAIGWQDSWGDLSGEVTVYGGVCVDGPNFAEFTNPGNPMFGIPSSTVTVGLADKYAIGSDPMFGTMVYNGEGADSVASDGTLVLNCN
ncbi:MAG: hypothetical protein GY774_13420 [Planctomycetes bacterium]|nr:hypothetical protein [Planctomycetota bacterium]